ncbi:MAG: gliding motility-associated ABC transporter permease subunit GldF [Cyclobacteriaceae bacterium]|nr:MAG: gliding motility-associated ABC transporter permease subunit GldF [Cyclobacteriaceae bacterium]
MISVFKKEVAGFLNSLIAYIVVSVFLTGIGLLMWVFPQTNLLDYGFADMESLFGLAPYVFMFLIPAICMKFFAEERKSGTMELLFTRPLTDYQVIFGKYLAGFFLVVFSLVPTLIYYYSVYELGNPRGNLDSAGIAGSYIGLLLLGSFFTALGVLASSLTENQIVAFILGAFLCFIWYDGIDALSQMDLVDGAGHQIERLGVVYHYNSLSRGLMDSRDIMYFVSITTATLLLTKLVIGSRKW